jgi:hypothetical protein
MSSFLSFIGIGQKTNNDENDNENYNKFIEYFKKSSKYNLENNYYSSMVFLQKAKDYLEKEIKEIKSINDNNKIKYKNKFGNNFIKDLFNYHYIINEEILNILQSFYSINYFPLIYTLNEVINLLLNEENFNFLCERKMCFMFINTICRLIYLNNHESIIFQLLIKKIHNYIHRLQIKLKFLTENEKNTLDELKNSFPIYHTKNYYDFNKYLEEKNVYNLIKMESSEADKLKAIDEFKSNLINLHIYSEQFDIIYKYAKEFFPPLTKLPKIALSKVYMKLGNLILKLLFLKDYTFTCYFDNIEVVEPSYNYFYINDNEESTDLKDFLFLHEKNFESLYNYEILQSYHHEIIDLTINYYVKPMIIFDINFEIQFLIYLMLKNLYFIYPRYRKYFINYIPTVLKNISDFNEPYEWNKSLECREFGYYLLSNDNIIQDKIKTMISVPKSEVRINKINIKNPSLNFGYMNKLVIVAGTKKEIIIDVNSENCLIYFEFYVEEGYDIDLFIYKINVKEEYDLILETDKISSISEDWEYMKNIKVIIFSKFITKYKFVFDNSYSWFREKIIHYSYGILKTSDKLNY